MMFERPTPMTIKPTTPIMVNRILKKGAFFIITTEYMTTFKHPPAKTRVKSRNKALAYLDFDREHLLSHATEWAKYL